jgi:acyl-CoA dehydrogenase
MHGEVFPADSAYRGYIEEFGRHVHPPVMDKLQRSARSRGLWNLYLGSESGLTNVEYAAVAEISGWSPTIAPEAMNCQAPDSGNMELLHLFASPCWRAGSGPRLR